MTNAKKIGQIVGLALFSITWDPKFPYVCDLMGFKSKVTPCLDVVRFDGKRCLGYIEKRGSPDSGDAKGKT